MSRILASTPAVLKDGTLSPWFRDLLLSILNDTEDLGTAAYKDVTTSHTDTTAGRVTKVGDFGWGGVIQNGLFDLNNAPIGSSITANGNNTDAGTYNWPDIGGSSPVWWNVLTIGSAARTTQIATQGFTNLYPSHVFTRSRHDSTWSAWRELWHTGNTIVDGSGFIKEA